MHFALVDSKRIEAQPSVIGYCCCCLMPVIAKCGSRKIWHWAHKIKTDCDSWWEPETKWHRAWKNNYPNEWQEVSLFDDRNREKHIADVRTAHNLVIEFQHSNITSQERISRERFYKNMVWVVDGTRLKRDYPRFLKGRNNCYENTIFYRTDNPKIFEVDLWDWCFPAAWLESTAPVIFDFLGDGTLDDPDGLRLPLYCLFPQVGRYARVIELSRNAFVKATTNGEWTSRVEKFMDEYRTQDNLKRQEQSKGSSRPSSKIIYAWNGIPLVGGRREYFRRFSAANKTNRRRRR